MNTAQQGNMEYLSAELEKAESARDEQEKLSEILESVRPTPLSLSGRSTHRSTGDRETSRRPQENGARERGGSRTAQIPADSAYIKYRPFVME